MNTEKKFSKYRLWCSSSNQHTTSESDEPPIPLLTEGEYEITLESNGELNVRNETFTEDKQRLFLSIFGLVTKEVGEVLLKKSQERKRRTCASPHILSLLLQAEKQDLDGNDPVEVKPRKRKSLQSTDHKDENINKKLKDDSEDDNIAIDTIQEEEDNLCVDDVHDEICHICNTRGELLLLCDTCPFVYHLLCLNIHEVPTGTWFCPRCKNKADCLEEPSYDDDRDITKTYTEYIDSKRELLQDAFSLRTHLNDLNQKMNVREQAIKQNEESESKCKKKIKSYVELLQSLDMFFAT